MTPQETKALVEEYRRLSALARQARARRRPTRGQRGNRTEFDHANAKRDIIIRLERAAHTKLAGMLTEWDDTLWKANGLSVGPVEAQRLRGYARTISIQISRVLETLAAPAPARPRRTRNTNH